MDYHRNLLDLHRLNPQRYPFLLQSVAHGTVQARYDILFAFPQHSVTLNAGESGDFLAVLDREWRAARVEIVKQDGPFHGGWFLYLGYELAAQIESRLAQLPLPNRLPVAQAVRVPVAFVKDHLRQSIEFVIEPGFEYLRSALEQDWAQAAHAVSPERALNIGELHEDDPQQFLQAVQRIKDYIVAGDVFQVNLSRRGWCALLNDVSDADLYARLCRSNPAPFAALALLGASVIISSSPERLVCVRNGVIETRPIAGTRPRGATAREDDDNLRELTAHPKERAEHIMLVDLERNDLGRVCMTGSVQVDELLGVESYTHVHHLVSNIRGVLRADVTPGEVIRAVFPGGTITGCPKVRCMEIIAELEGAARGAYTGAVGYLNHDGSMDLNILIRTLVRSGARVEWRAGAGIVADSIAERELDETRAKARGLLRALR
ncbi:MAG: aminodeoxychorismate synthase component I [Gammaproteobacteria bacterium]|nr:aminodeoxychorismate synthase component I [Gammaproteobacteria bacterium]